MEQAGLELIELCSPLLPNILKGMLYQNTVGKKLMLVKGSSLNNVNALWGLGLSNIFSPKTFTRLL